MSLDAEILVVAWDAPDGNREPSGLFRIQIVVTARLLFADAKRIAYEISRHQHEIGTPRFDNGAELL